MKLVFIGSSRFGLRCLKLATKLLNINVIGVVTAPKKFSISYMPKGVTNILHADVESFCNSNKIPCLTLEHNMKDDGLFDEVSKWKPEAFLVVGWYHIIPKKWRSLAPAYGLHASLLPDYSGGAPLVWAIINGETKTGISLFQMNDSVDAGPILGQVEEPILERDTINTLYKRIEEKGLKLIKSELPKIQNNRAKLFPQKNSNRRIFPQRSPMDGKIDWNQDANYIDRFIRAQTRPYPGAFTKFCGENLIIWKAEQIQKSYPLPGQIILKNKQVWVGCRYNSLRIDAVQYRGKYIEGVDLAILFKEKNLTLVN